jgi:F-type H+-transporting ATPase subunit delta
MKITPKQYAQVLYDLTDGKSKSEIEKSVVDFARHIYKERELKLADKIIGQFSKIYDRKNGIVEATMISARKPESSQVHKVKNFVKEKYGAKEVVLRNVVNENIKGGIVVKVGDEIMDGSIAERLASLKNILTKP